ncbi:uncharacterized protein LOC120425040 [Culex pipiens pallens]|uniref:uncharacterized protein LOC120425040 n=1 Tax=Culex pipiens pallens TaxID=42434 RepID=UPI001954EEED|nr:uncharacterized protein LOC120425040 [Culex pipiens pallens]
MLIRVALPLLFAIYFHSATSGASSKCAHSIVFNKLLGVRPPSTNSTVIPLYAAASKSREESAVNVRCARICREDLLCHGYLLVFSQNACYGYSTAAAMNPEGMTAAAASRYEHIDDDVDANYQLVADANVAFFVKTCLDVPAKCSSKLFPLVTIPGAGLVGQNDRLLPRLVTREECANACFHLKKNFRCRSARFVRSFRNNRHRLRLKVESAPLGQCYLSGGDRFTNPESFRYGGWGDDEEYLENQCEGWGRGAASCSFEQQRDLAFAYADDSLIVSDERGCSERCLNEDRFTCAGYSYHNSSGRSTCSLHSDDLTSLGPKAIRVEFDSVYGRRVRCLDVTAQCYDERIEVGFVPSEGFAGRIYLNTVHGNCSYDETMANGTRMLTIMTGNEVVESRCGIRRAFIKGNVNNFLVFGYVYIQQHPMVRTQADRLLKAGCIHHLNSTIITNLMSNLPMKSTVDFIPQSQSLSFGSTVLLNGTSKITKKVTVHLYDVETQAELFEAALGQLVEMRIVSKDRNFDLAPYDLIAYSGEETLPLLDSKGCPLDRRIFPGFRKQKTTPGLTLQARFHAFTFPRSTMLNFRLTIKFCYESCPKVVCFYQ